MVLTLHRRLDEIIDLVNAILVNSFNAFLHKLHAVSTITIQPFSPEVVYHRFSPIFLRDFIAPEDWIAEMIVVLKSSQARDRRSMSSFRNQDLVHSPEVRKPSPFKKIFSIPFGTNPKQ